MSGGWKIVKTMGTRITKVTPLEGMVAETAGAFTLYITEDVYKRQEVNTLFRGIISDGLSLRSVTTISEVTA